MPKLETILESLEYIKKNGPLDSSCGICRSLYLLLGNDLDKSYKWVQTESKTWKYHSGDEDYPVPGSNCYTDSKWSKTTDEGRLRYDLLDFLIELAKELRV